MEIGYRLMLPPDFLQKQVNEGIAAAMLASAYGLGEGQPGLPPQPDIMWSEDVGTEVTFAAGSHHQQLFIREYCDGVFRPGAEPAASRTQPILAALERKAAKTYSTPHTSLAVLCMLELFDWTAPDCPEREAFFEEVRRRCILPGPFETVYLMVPSLQAEWFVYDVAAGTRKRLLILDHLQAPYYKAMYIKE
ncbi:MAG: hypothetical protein IJP03_00070 [Christensenellaceae bacterium]|nr:hypothetical protein [Christensenellaceae bacterium]